MVLRLCGLKLLFGSIVLVDSAEAGYYFILFCFVDKVVEALFKFFGAYLCGLDVGYPDVQNTLFPFVITGCSDPVPVTCFMLK